MNTLSTAIVALALIGTALGDFCSTPTEHPVYNIDQLPYGCVAGFNNCSSNFCACVGMVWNPETMECQAPQTPSKPTCSSVSACLKNYTECVNGQYTDAEDSGAADNCTSDAAGFTFFHNEALQAVVSPDLWNTTQLFGSCASFLCRISNASSCELDPYEVCVIPSGLTVPITPEPGSTPAPTNPDGSFAVPTKIVVISISFTADFDTLMSTDAGQLTAMNEIGSGLTKKLAYKTTCKTISYKSSTGKITQRSQRRKNVALAAGTLDANAQAVIPASDTSTLAAVQANAAGLSSSSGWYQGLASACGCSIPPPMVNVVTVDGNTPQSSSSSKCSSGCIAGVVVGGTAAVTIGVGAVAYTSMKKTAAVAPDPTK